MKTNLLNMIELNADHIDRAYDDLVLLLEDIGMKDKADDIVYALPAKLATANPFMGWFEGLFYPTPTDVIISEIYDLAKGYIKEKYPEAEIGYKANGYYSTFNIDAKTYNNAVANYKEGRTAE